MAGIFLGQVPYNGPDGHYIFHRKLELLSFPAGTPPARHGGDIHRRRRYVAAVPRQPAQRLHQLRCQLDTFRVDGEALVINPALAGVHIQIAAGFQGVEDRSPLILDLFKAAHSAAPAEGLPFFIFHHGIRHIFVKYLV